MSPDPEPPEPPVPTALPVEAVVADQAAAHAAAGPRPHRPIHAHCENCGTPLAGPWCHRCGQHDFEFHRSFWHVFLEALENFLHFEGKFFTNTVTLLFRPGRLTAEFNAGKRAAQMPPFRLYLFVSVLFFFLLFLHGDGPPEAGRDRVKSDVDSTVDGRPVSPLEAIHAATQAATEDDAAPPAAVPPGAPAAAKSTEPAPAERSVDKVRHFAEQLQAEAEKSRAAQPKDGKDRDLERWLVGFSHRISDPAQRAAMADHFLHSLPKMLLLCLPCFALYTRVLFRRSGLVYLQHLVLALHFHTFIYLWLMIRDGWVFLAGLPGWGLAPVASALCKLWMWIYPVVMLRRLFGDSWKKTLLKTGLLSLAYLLTLSLVMFVGAVIIFVFL